LDNAPLAALRAVIPGLPFGGTVSGRVALEGMPGDAPLNLDVRLELAQGVFTVQGLVDLRTDVPSYDVEGTILGLNLQDVFTSFAPPALLTGRFTLDGRGFDPATATARMSLGGRFTGWETGADDVVRARAVVENGTLRVDTLGMRLSTMTFAGAGSWRFVTPQTGAITYELAVASLEPWGPYLPMADSSASGSILARGTVTGPLEAVRVAGTFSGDGIELGSGWSAQDIEAEYDATVGSPVPRIELLATARNLGTPTAGSFYVITTSMQLTPPTFALDLSGMRENAAGEAIELVASGNVPYEGAREIIVERAHLDIEDGLWRLTQPATISWGAEDGVRVRDLEFRNEGGEGRLAIDGRLLPLERTDLTLDIARLPAAEVQLLLGREPVISGDLWASGTVRNLAATPDIDLTFRLDSGAVMDVALARFTGEIDYREGALVTTAQAAFDTTGTLDLELAVPFRFVIEDSLAFGMGDAGPISGTIRADRVSLVPFEALFTGLRDLQGWATGALTLAGTIADPQLAGEVAIVQAAATVPVLNKRYEQINGTLSFAGRQILIDSLSATAGGTARVAGTITLEELTEPVLDIEAVMTDFQAAGVDNETDAEVTGTIAATGALDALTVTGSVQVGDGAVLIPNVAQSTLDEDIFLAPGETFEGPLIDSSPGLVDNLRIRDLRVDVHRDTWFVLEGRARTQLGGVLVVNKTGEDWRVVGELEGERGTYTVAAGPIVRQFDITYIRLRFQDEAELNPSVEVIATRTIIDQSGRPIDIDVNIGGTLQTPTLALGSGDAANVPQSELLSFLFFGQPSFALGGAGLAGEALGGFGELLGIGLGNAFGEVGLPFDVFQLRLTGFGGLGANTAMLVVGSEITDDVFLTVESYLNALFGESQSGLDAWAIKLEWAFARRSSLSTGFEPVNSALLLRGVGLDRSSAPGQQLFVELRRRWLW
ncbi:MAG: translocation/assembly module TamB domain-containing protein, partial [Longimicrobiales bacterium]